MLDRSFLFCLVSHCCNFFFSWCGYHLDLHVLTHSVPTRRLFRSYRIRDELNVERAAQGKPPIAANQRRTAAGKRAAKAAEWQIGRAHVCTPVTNAHLVCRLLLEKTNSQSTQLHPRPHEIQTIST